MTSACSGSGVATAMTSRSGKAPMISSHGFGPANALGVWPVQRLKFASDLNDFRVQRVRRRDGHDIEIGKSAHDIQPRLRTSKRFGSVAGPAPKVRPGPTS